MLGVTLFLGALLSQRLLRLVRIRHINGPLLSKVTGIPHILALLSDNCHDWYYNLNQKYGMSPAVFCFVPSVLKDSRPSLTTLPFWLGELVAISPTTLLTSSPDLWARMNTHPGYTKAEWYYRAARFDWRNDNVFSQIDNQKHDARRKQMVKGVSLPFPTFSVVTPSPCINQNLLVLRV